MPITKKMSKEETFHDLRHGKAFKKTNAKFGKKKAQEQMVARAAAAGKLPGKSSGKKKTRNKGRH